MKPCPLAVPQIQALDIHLNLIPGGDSCRLPGERLAFREFSRLGREIIADKGGISLPQLRQHLIELVKCLEGQGLHPPTSASAIG